MKNVYPFIISALCLLMITSFSHGQITLTGTVYDTETKEPIPGANILIQGTSGGSVTNMDGQYTIEVIPGQTIVASFIGYANFSTVISNQTQLDIYLESDFQDIEEIIVVGYGVQKKSEVIGSISSVDGDDLENLSSANLSQALQGRAAGVQITQNSGTPGSNVTFKIRGVSTVNNTSPLYVVDGIISEDINYLSPEDIKSIEVLKDAASASIYGARGANGVVMVTTKQGEAGKITVSAGSSFSTQDYWKEIEMVDKFTYDMYEYAAELRESLLKELITEDPVEYNNKENWVSDWLGKISQPSSIQKYYVNIAGGSEKFTYYFGANYNDNQGIIIGTDYRKTNLTFNTSSQLNDKMQLSLRTSYSNALQHKQDEGNWNILRRTLTEKPKNLYDDDYGYLNDTPYRKVLNTDNSLTADVLVVNVSYDYKIFKSLKFTSNFGYTYNIQEKNNFIKRDDQHEYLYTDDRSSAGLRKTEHTVKETKSKKYSWDNIFNFSKEIGKHAVTATGVYSMEWFHKSSINTGGYNLIGNKDNGATLGNIHGGYKVSGNPTEWSQVGLAARIHYNYDERYILQLNGRADASSRFAKENRWGYFPSVSVGWRISQEDFMSGLSWINMLKLRASWGQGGNNRIDNYTTYTQVEQTGIAAYGSDGKEIIEPGISPKSIGNPGIVWEQTTTYNIGLEMGFFRKIYPTVEVFEKYTSDILLRVFVPSSTGFDSFEHKNDPMQNAGEIRNRGIEFTLNYRERLGQFGFEIGGNITYLQNKVMTLGLRNEPVYGGNISNPELGNVTRTEVGNEISEYYGWVTNGVFTNKADVEASAQPYAQPGDIRFIDLNGDGRITEADKTYIGSPHPDYTYGFNLKMDYKGFDFGMFWVGVYGNKIFNRMRYYYDGFNGSTFRAENVGQFYNPGVKEDEMYFGMTNFSHELYPVNKSPDALPRLTTAENDFNRNYRASDFYVEDGSYLRLQNLQLGYKVPAEWVERIKMKSMRLYVGAENLLTFTNYSGLEPEISKQQTEDSDDEDNDNTGLGIDMGIYPQTVKFTFGINLKF